MSSHARTQRVQRMHVDMSCWMIGSPSRSSPVAQRQARSVAWSARRSGERATRIRCEHRRAGCLPPDIARAASTARRVDSSPRRRTRCCTRIPSAAAVAHEATSFGAPSTCTRQIRQLPTTGSFGYQHSVGTSIASARAASSMVDPAGTVTDRPSIVSVGMKTDSSKRSRSAVSEYIRRAQRWR